MHSPIITTLALCAVFSTSFALQTTSSAHLPTAAQKLDSIPTPSRGPVSMAWLSANIAAVAATSSAHSSGQMSSGKAMMTMSNGSMMPMSGKGGMSMSMSGAMPTGSAAAAMGKTGSATKHGVSEESWRLGMLLVGVGAGALLEL